MDQKTIARIFEETAYVRMGGSPEELKTAEYIVSECAKFGCEAKLEAFPVDMSTISQAVLIADGREIPCKGYLNAGNGDVEAPLYYLTDNTPYSLERCKGKIVLFDGYLGYWRYQDLLKYGAVGFISFDGNANYADRDIDQRELRSYVSNGKLLPGVNINVKDAIALVRDEVQTAKIILTQESYQANSHNVVLDLPGELPQYILLCAHYDSTSLSQGAYDNMSGSIGLLSMAQTFADKPHRYGLRFVWCGSEERGLLGSKAYCAAHKETLDEIVLNINLDMIGCIMGGYNVCCTTEEKAVGYVQYMASELGFGCSVRQGIRSTDSTVFADNGIPALSFDRMAPGNAATIHNSYDTRAVVSPAQMEKDIAFIAAFLDRMANAVHMPIAREIPDSMKEKIDVYMMRKRSN